MVLISVSIVFKVLNNRLDNIAVILEETADQHITADIELITDLPLNSKFRIEDEVTVGINMFVESVIPINVEIPIDQNLLVPFKIGVKEYIKLDTTIMITDDVFAIVEDTLHLDQDVTVPTSKRRGVNLPIKASIPLSERVKVKVNQAIPVHAVVPIDLLIIDTLAVGLSIKVPVNVMVPVRIPVNTTAKVSFPEAIPVAGTIPVAITIPADIPLAETTLAGYFIKLAQGLRGLTSLKNRESCK